jgi:ABC-2 type transport system permease protein
MITDIGTIIWKEWKEIFLQRGSRRSSFLSLAVIIGMVGVFFPLQAGREWLTSPTGLITWAWLPLFLVMGVVADAFAGERERHTLETLLASRLPDRAILFGKIGAAVLYGWSITVVSVLLGAITVNVTSRTGRLLFYPASLFAAILILSLLTSLLMAGIGVLVSLSSATTRVAYQKMSLAFMAVWFVPFIALSLIPRRVLIGLTQSLPVLNIQQLGIGAVIVLVILDIIFILAAMNRFRRSRLILD